jgi:hypothetical protein
VSNKAAVLEKDEELEDETEEGDDREEGSDENPYDEHDSERGSDEPTAAEPAYTEDAMGVRTLVPTGAHVPEPIAATPKPKEPTLQMTSLGGDFLNFTPYVHAVQCVRQVGTPTTTNKTVKAKRTVTERDDTGADVTKIVEVDEVITETEYKWADEYENMGDPFASLTGALRNQYNLAGLHIFDANGTANGSGYTRKEYLKTEYGVWYVTEPTGKLPGYRYSIMLVPCPANLQKAPKPEKKVRVPKPPKPPKEPKEPKVPKEPKLQRESKTRTNTGVVKSGKTGRAVADAVGAVVHSPQGEVPETVIDED